MANFDRPRGFEPKGEVQETAVYEAGAEIFPGDAIVLSSDGQVDSASTDTALLGIAMEYASAAGERILCSVSPTQKYIVQADEDDIDARTDIGNNADLLATSGDSTYNTSRHELDSNSIGPSAAQFNIIDINQSPNNSGGAQADVVVMINEHQLYGKDAYSGV